MSFVTAFIKVDGYENLIEMYFNATATNRSVIVDKNGEEIGFCGEVPKDSMHLFRTTVPGESDFPWTGVRKNCNLEQNLSLKPFYIPQSQCN